MATFQLNQRLVMLCWLCFLLSAGFLFAYFEGMVSLTQWQFVAAFSVSAGVLFLAPRYLWQKAKHLEFMFAMAMVVVYAAADAYDWHIVLAISAAVATFIIGSLIGLSIMMYSPHKRVFVSAVTVARLNEQHMWQNLSYHLPVDPIPMWEYVSDVHEPKLRRRLSVAIIALCYVITNHGLHKDPNRLLTLPKKDILRLMKYVADIDAILAEYDEVSS